MAERETAWKPGSQAKRGLKRSLSGAYRRLTTRQVWSRLMAEGKAEGRPRSALDMILAVLAEVNDCVEVTDNDGTSGDFRSSIHCGKGAREERVVGPDSAAFSLRILLAVRTLACTFPAGKRGGAQALHHRTSGEATGYRSAHCRNAPWKPLVKRQDD